jgi:hypothetical protein
VAVAGLHSGDHLGAVHEDETMRGVITIERIEPLPGVGGRFHGSRGDARLALCRGDCLTSVIVWASQIPGGEDDARAATTILTIGQAGSGCNHTLMNKVVLELVAEIADERRV